LCVSDDDCDDDLDDHMFLCNAKARIIIIIIFKPLGLQYIESSSMKEKSRCSKDLI